MHVEELSFAQYLLLLTAMDTFLVATLTAPASLDRRMHPTLPCGYDVYILTDMYIKHAVVDDEHEPLEQADRKDTQAGVEPATSAEQNNMLGHYAISPIVVPLRITI
jgi:hypothetical protein